MLCSLTVVAALAVASGLAAWRVLHPSVAAKYATQNVVFSQPNAPHLTAAPGERVYRIDPMQSSVQYTVKEELFGVGVHRAHGITNGVAGDIALNSEAPARSRVGEIVVNVEQLHSDNSLRDAQIRKGYLSSHTFRFAYFNATTLTGLPAKLTQGRTYRFNLLGVLKVKNTQRPITWTVAGSLANGKLEATAVTHVKMSQFGIGPIELAGLVSTSDDVTLTMHLVAEDPSRYDVPTTVPVPNAAHRGAATSPSFKAAVMPILEADCASCHNSGGVGAAHWKLDTAGDAAQYADGVSAVVRAKYMPPWPASDKGIALANSKALDQKSIAVLEKWSDAGGPIDVPAATKIAPSKTRSVPHPRPDKTLTMRRAYAGSLSTPNDYRCFVLDPQLTTPTWLTGYEVVPGDREEIHHVQIFHISAAQAHAGQVASGQDGKPGWSCGKNLQLAISMQSGLIAAWAPGQDPTIYPDEATMKKLFTIVAQDQKTIRLTNRLWTKIKTGQ